MKQKDPTANLNYVDIHSELQDLRINDVVELYSLPKVLLASFGSLGRDGTRRLHYFARVNFLEPLGLLETKADETRLEVITVHDSSSKGEQTEVEVMSKW